MRFSLRDYQEDAVRDIGALIGKYGRRWTQDGDRSAFPLVAPTGSGKTVIAAAVIEAVIHGSDEHNIEADPGAVFLWVSKDPALNRQTRHRFIEAADRIPTSDLVLLDKDYQHEKLQAGKVYFINPAKLSKNALFVKHSDTRHVTFWDILDNTIKDRNLTLYMVLDEAHEGVRPLKASESRDNQTIVMRIITGSGNGDGSGANQPVPVVWGISATPNRFTEAMGIGRNGDHTHASHQLDVTGVRVDPARVKASGLIKQTLHADIPDEEGVFVTTLVKKATAKFAAVCRRWDEYSAEQNLENPVVPLMVVQIPNKGGNTGDGDASSSGDSGEDRLIGQVLDLIRQGWDDFTPDCVAHVVGERGDITAPGGSGGGIKIRKVAPEDVQADTGIRVLIAKDAISTGWDCPRAEVLVSLRPGRDHTYITQLLGRMVRTPLARETSDGVLNSAVAFLPHFSKEQTEAVVTEIMGLKEASGHKEGAGPRVMFKPVNLEWNPNVPAEVRDLIEGLVSEPKPAADPKPVKRLFDAAIVFAYDGLVPDADKQAVEVLCQALDGFAAQHRSKVDAMAAEIRTAEIRTVTAHLGEDEASSVVTRGVAGHDTVDDAEGKARRMLGAKLAVQYRKRLFVAAGEDTAQLLRVKSEVAALAAIDTGAAKTASQVVDDAADALLKDWMSKYHSAIKLLPEARRVEYDRIESKARDVEATGLELNDSVMVDTVDKGKEPLLKAGKHVLSDPDGLWPVEEAMASNSWEMEVLRRELGDDLTGDSVPALEGWYRNPASGSSKTALRIAYLDNGKWKSVQPDFVFVHRDGDGKLWPSILDPHGTHLSDALPKLAALAGYAEKYGDRFLRVQAMAAPKPGEPLLSLDLQDENVRAAVRSAVDSGLSAASVFQQVGTILG